MISLVRFVPVRVTVGRRCHPAERMSDSAAVSTRLMSRVLCAVGVLLCLGALPGVAHAQQQSAELASTMVVLDASGSMAGAAPAGGTKMDAAERAVHTFLDAAPDSAPV